MVWMVTGTEDHGRASPRAGTAARWLPLAAFLFAALCTALPVLGTLHLPLVDLPNHIARLAVAAAPQDGALAAYYAYVPAFVPNAAADLVWRALPVEADPARFAQVLMALYAVNLIASAMVLSRALHGRWSAWPAAAGLLVLSGPFFWGFQNFVWSLPFCLYALALWLVMEDGPRLRWRGAVFVPVAAALYLMHFFAFALLAIAVFGREVQRALEDGGPLAGRDPSRGTGGARIEPDRVRRHRRPPRGPRLAPRRAEHGGLPPSRRPRGAGPCAPRAVPVAHVEPRGAAPRAASPGERARDRAGRRRGPRPLLAQRRRARPHPCAGPPHRAAPGRNGLAGSLGAARPAPRDCLRHAHRGARHRLRPVRRGLRGRCRRQGARVLPLRAPGLEPDRRFYHVQALLVAERDVFVPTLFQGVHELRVLDRWADHAEPVESAIDLRWVLQPELAADLARPVFTIDWERKFTHALLLDRTAPELTDDPRLEPVARAGRFTLFRIVPPAP
ncbi:MAG: hypothetical protein MUF63_13890 [Rhodobacteraceae bacterium]|nr:hypothetical protein [Paracoccaceae bacterium]